MHPCPFDVLISFRYAQVFDPSLPVVTHWRLVFARFPFPDSHSLLPPCLDAGASTLPENSFPSTSQRREKRKRKSVAAFASHLLALSSVLAWMTVYTTTFPSTALLYCPCSFPCFAFLVVILGQPDCSDAHTAIPAEQMPGIRRCSPIWFPSTTCFPERNLFWESAGRC